MLVPWFCSWLQGAWKVASRRRAMEGTPEAPKCEARFGGTGRPQDQAPVMTRIRATLQCQPDTSGRTAGIKARTQTATSALAIQSKDSNSNVGIAVQSTATRWGIAPVCSQCACSHRRAADVRACDCMCVRRCTILLFEQRQQRYDSTAADASS